MMVFNEVSRKSDLEKIHLVAATESSIINNSSTKQSYRMSQNSEHNKIENPLPVLLVEDDQITQEVIKMFLEGAFKIDLAINAEEAIEKVRQNEYFAVLMDINLGRGLNGVHVTKEIRRLPGKTSLPIVAQTAFAMKGDQDEFFKAGCNYYLAKPYSKKDLQDILMRIHGSGKT